VSKKTIAIDIDDVLSKSADGFIKYSNERWGLNLRTEDYEERWAVMWGTDSTETESRAVEFHDSGVVRDYVPDAEAAQVLSRLAKKYKLVVVTSRRVVLKWWTQEWLEKHFAGMFAEVHFAGFYDNLDDNLKQKHHLGTKGEIAHRVGADYLIDDQLKHVVTAAELGVKAILFGSYKWNQVSNLPQAVTRCKNWKEIEEYFAGE